MFVSGPSGLLMGLLIIGTMLGGCGTPSESFPSPVRSAPDQVLQPTWSTEDLMGIPFGSDGNTLEERLTPMFGSPTSMRDVCDSSVVLYVFGNSLEIRVSDSIGMVEFIVRDGWTGPNGVTIGSPISKLEAAFPDGQIEGDRFRVEIASGESRGTAISAGIQSGLIVARISATSLAYRRPPAVTSGCR